MKKLLIGLLALVGGLFLFIVAIAATVSSILSVEASETTAAVQTPTPAVASVTPSTTTTTPRATLPRDAQQFIDLLAGEGMWFVAMADTADQQSLVDGAKEFVDLLDEVAVEGSCSMFTLMTEVFIDTFTEDGTVSEKEAYAYVSAALISFSPNGPSMRMVDRCS